MWLFIVIIVIILLLVVCNKSKIDNFVANYGTTATGLGRLNSNNSNNTTNIVLIVIVFIFIVGMMFLDYFYPLKKIKQ